MLTTRITRKAEYTYRRRGWSTMSRNCLVAGPNQRERQLRVDQQARYYHIRQLELPILKGTIHTSEEIPYTFNVTSIITHTNQRTKK